MSQLHIIAILGVITSTGQAHAQEPSRKGTHFGEGPEFSERYERDYETLLMGRVMEEPNGNLAAIGAMLRFSPFEVPLSKHLEGYDLGSVVTHYPPLRENDIVAARGYLFRAIRPSLGIGAKPKHGIGLAWVPAKEAPPGVSVQWDSMVVPMRSGYENKKVNSEGSAQLQRHFLILDKVEASATKDANPKLNVAHLRIHKEGELTATAVPVKLKVGNILVLREAGHKVRKIVPPDAKTQVIGWVELELKPIPEADLIKDKIPFIRPERK